MSNLRTKGSTSIADISIPPDQVPGSAYESFGDEIFGGDENNINALADYLNTVIPQERDGSNRSDFKTNVERWKRHRSMTPEQAKASYPWDGSSNVVPPKTAANTNNMFARAKSLVQARDPRVSGCSYAQKWEKHAEVCAKLLNRLNDSPMHIDIRKKDTTILYDGISLGTQVVEIPWSSRAAKFMALGVGGTTRPVDKVLYEGPAIDPVRIQDVLFPTGWYDPQLMPWLAFEKRYTKQQMVEFARNGFFGRTEVVTSSPEKKLPDYLESDATAIGITIDLSSPGNETYTVYRTYIFWDPLQDGNTIDLVVWFSQDTKTILRTEYNYLGLRPVEPVRYIEIPFEFYGIGTGKLSESSQEELITLHNMRINSQHLHSLQMVAVRRGSGLRQGEKFRPGKMIDTTSPREDWSVIGFPDVSQSSMEAESIVNQYLDLATSMSDAARGMSDNVAKSRTSPTLQQFLSDRGDSLLSTIIDGIQQSYSRIYMYELLQIVAHADRSKTYIVPLLDDPNDQALFEEVLAIPVEDIPYNFYFIMETTKMDETKDAKRQSIVMKNQLFDAYAQQVLGYMSALANPQLTEMMRSFVLKALETKHKLMEEALNLLGTKEANEAVGYYKDIETVNQIIALMKDQQVAQLQTQLEALRARAGQGNGGGSGGGLGGGLGNGVAGSPALAQIESLGEPTQNAPGTSIPNQGPTPGAPGGPNSTGVNPNGGVQPGSGGGGPGLGGSY